MPGRPALALARAALLLAAPLGGCAPDLGPAPPRRVAVEDLGDAPERWTRFLERYLAIDTTNPPGNEARAFPLLGEALGQLGLTATVAALGPDRGNLSAILEAPSPDPGAGPLVLLHHVDVVPVERDRWTADPFGGEVRDGRLYGRGAIDAKLLAALHLAALERLAARRGDLRRSVIFLAVSDEEQGGTGAALAVRTLVPRWRPEYLLDEGGFAVRGLVDGRDLAVIAVAQKRKARVALVAEGEAGHGSRPLRGGGPDVLVEALHRLAAEPPRMRLGPTTRATFERFGALAAFPRGPLLARLDWPGVLWALEGSLSKERNLAPMLRDTWAVIRLEAGQKDNVIPAEARAILDVRLLPDTPVEALVSRLEGALAGLPVRVVVEEPPPPASPPSPVDDPLFGALRDALRAHEPGAAVAPWLMIGMNDSRFFAPLGVKTYGFSPVFLEKAQLDGIHGHDEHVALDELRRGFAVHVEALERFLLRAGPH